MALNGIIKNILPKKCYLAVITLVIFSFLSPFSFASEKVVLQLKWLHQFQFAGYYAAQSQGYFTSEGLDVEIRESESERSTLDVVLSGDAQFGISDSSIVLSRMQGKPLVIIAAIFQHSPMVLITLESSGIQSATQLKNKRVMYRKNVDDAVLLAMFTELGLGEESHDFIENNFSHDPLTTGEADAFSAYISDQPYYFQKRKIPINILSPANYGIDFYGDMLFVEQNYFEENREQVLAFRRATIKGWNYAINHQEEIVDWILNNTSTRKSRDNLLYEAERTARLVQAELIEIGYLNRNRFLRISQIYKQLGMASPEADLSGIDYKDYDNQNYLVKNIKIVTLVLLIVGVLFIISWVVNLRLKSQVVFRTAELEDVNNSLERYVNVVNHYVISCTTTLDGTITDVSQAFCDTTGYKKTELIGKNHTILRHPDVPVEVFEDLWKTLNNDEIWSGELLSITKDGTSYWLSSEIEPIFDINGSKVGYTSVSVDVSDKKKIEQMSMTDSLSGLANRRHLDQVFIRTLAQAKRYEEPLSVVIFDLDNFKGVNDSFGHIAGDLVIKTVGEILRDNIRAGDIPGRWGGDEYVVIFPETDLTGAERVSELLRAKIQTHEFLNLPKQTCSFGVAQWNVNESQENLFVRADKALYKAKEKGRNRVEVSHY